VRYTPVVIAAALALALPGVAYAHGHEHGHGHDGHGLKGVDRIVVIYEENHSFDNLYGGWEGVDGLRHADPAHTKQVNQAGTPYSCLLQNDVNLSTPPLRPTCHDATTATPFDSHFTNDPFRIDDFISPADTTCPPPGDSSKPTGWLKGTGLPGGCTRDLVHRYYQEQYQLDGGKQDRYVTGSDAVGLTMGTYDTRALPIYKYLHAPGHPKYAIADRFFQAAFGGSFLNHQWLIAAATPMYPNADRSGGPSDLHSVLDANGMPTSYPLYKATGPVKDGALTALCGGSTPAGLGCGDYAVNTIQPAFQPFSSPTAAKLPAQTAPTIGDRLSDKGVDWAWYSGGWSNANGDVDAPGWTNGSGPTCSDPNTATGATFPNCPGKLFQYHHQPFNYFASFAPGTAQRAAHLRDEAEFLAAVKGSKWRCDLKPVSFVKPFGEENEHPGYASESSGSSHLVDLLSAIRSGGCSRHTMVVVTYDEFGGQWDHVTPPGQGGAPGPHDVWGPSTRIPALVLAPHLPGDFVVDHTQYDTTSIMATIERRFGLAPVSSRDAAVNDLSHVFGAGSPHHHH
jgi:acid phosphatase